jgi:hypothetical protein
MNSPSNTLIGQKTFPAVSIIYAVHPQYPKFKTDRERMISLLTEAQQKVEEKYSKQKSDAIMNKVHRVVNNITFDTPSQGLAIYVSSEIEKVIHLPFPVTEKVIVDESFEVRDVVQAAKKNVNYLLVLINANHVRTFVGYGPHRLQVRYGDMPDNLKDVSNEHSYPGWDYFDAKAFEEKNLRNYLKFIDEVIEKENKKLDYPIIIAADKKILGNFLKHTHNDKKIIGKIEGGFEHTNMMGLNEKVDAILDQTSDKERQKALTQLKAAVNKDTYAAGITEVWRAAAEARGKLLLVEKNYRQAARFGDDSYTIVIDDSVKRSFDQIPDAVDDIIELVLRNKGDVIFMEDDSLSSYKRIALITRY